MQAGQAIKDAQPRMMAKTEAPTAIPAMRFVRWVLQEGEAAKSDADVRSGTLRMRTYSGALLTTM